MKPTIKDVAKKAEVSIATVSRILNKLGGYSPGTEEKVNKEKERSIEALLASGQTPLLKCLKRLAQSKRSDLCPDCRSNLFEVHDGVERCFNCKKVRANSNEKKIVCQRRKN